MNEFLGLDIAQWDVAINAGQLLVLLLLLWRVDQRRKARGEPIEYEEGP